MRPTTCRVIPGTVAVARVRARGGPWALSATGIAALGIVAGVRSGWVRGVAWAAAPLVITLAASVLLVGWSPVRRTLEARLDDLRAGAAGRHPRRGRFGERWVLVEGPGGRVRHVRFRGPDPHVDPGRLVALLVVPVGRRRYVVWARDLASGTRWGAASLHWTLFAAATLLVAAVQAVSVGG